MKNLFQIGKMFLRNPETELPEPVRSDLIKGTIRWFKPEYAADISEGETLRLILKNMRYSLIAEAAKGIPQIIEKTGIRAAFPEVPEYKIRRLALSGIIRAFETSATMKEFAWGAPFLAEQYLRKQSANSIHSINLYIDGHCSRGSGEWK